MERKKKKKLQLDTYMAELYSFCSVFVAFTRSNSARQENSQYSILYRFDDPTIATNPNEFLFSFCGIFAF